MFQAAVIGVSGFLFFLLIVLVVLRRKQGYGPSLSAILTAVVCYLMLFALVILLGKKTNFWALSSTYWFFCLCFMLLFGVFLKSISLRILLLLFERGELAEDYLNILNDCILRDSYEERLKILVDASFATRRSDGFLLTDKGRRIAEAVHRLQSLFRIEKSG